MLRRVFRGLMSIVLVGSRRWLLPRTRAAQRRLETGGSITKDVVIYSRPHADSPLKEFKAIGPIDAPTYAVHAVIDDFENYPKFMPYTIGMPAHKT